MRQLRRLDFVLWWGRDDKGVAALRKSLARLEAVDTSGW
jgi:hypothetical protein